ncbi:MAG TPA: cupin domain-containing protein [Chloroflexota bacterium]|nr:cupin domain-containing protein [Chloroflexota bacterium]
MALEVFDARTDIRNLFITPEIRSRIMRFEPGQVSHGHTHDVGHEMFLVVDGQAEFTIAGQSAVLGPGQMCVARAGEWHEIRIVGDRPMTLYLSVTPHIEPTHTQWDQEGGTPLPYRYGGSTRLEPSATPAALLERHLAASTALARAAQDNAAAQAQAATRLSSALDQADSAAAHAAVDEMWRAFRALHARLRESELIWNELAPAAARD